MIRVFFAPYFEAQKEASFNPGFFFWLLGLVCGARAKAKEHHKRWQAGEVSEAPPMEALIAMARRRDKKETKATRVGEDEAKAQEAAAKVRPQLLCQGCLGLPRE